MVNSRLKSGRSVRDSMKSDSRLATKVVVLFRPFFYCTRSLPDRLVFYGDPRLLQSQDIFRSIFCAAINNRIRTDKAAIPSKSRFLSLSSSFPQADLGIGAGINPSFSPVLCSDTLLPGSLTIICLAFPGESRNSVITIIVRARFVSYELSLVQPLNPR
jgi:hypothetical protein